MNFLLHIKPARSLCGARGQCVTAESGSEKYDYFFFSLFSSFSYYKVKEPASWVNVDRQSGDLKVANTIDRESKFVIDGKYIMTMKAVDAGKLPPNNSSLVTVWLRVPVPVLYTDWPIYLPSVLQVGELLDVIFNHCYC